MKPGLVVAAGLVAWALTAGAALAQQADAPSPYQADVSPMPQAQALATAGRFDDVLRLLGPWLDRRPHDAEARELYARVLLWEQRPGEALSQFDRVLAEAPDDPDTLLGKAQTLMALGRPEEAVAVLDRARGVAPRYEEVWETELQALAAEGDAGEIPSIRLRNEASAYFPNAAWLTHLPQGPRPIPGPWSLELGGGYEALTNNFAPWTDAGFILTRTLAPRQAGVVLFHDVGRFGLHDQEGGVAWYQPFGRDLTCNVQATFSPEHQVLPVWSATAEADYALPLTFSLDLGLVRTVYTTADTWRETLTLDKYLGPFRVAYTLAVSELPGAPLTLGHIGQLDYFYNEDSSESLSVHTGQEEEFTSPNTLLVSDVTGVELRGRTFFSTQWGVTHGVDYEIQGTVYNRMGAQLGLVYRF